jgi:mannose-6-phosphate isomerase-like protein (cupin superfamily)
MSHVQGKCWGTSSPIFKNEFVELHKLFVAAEARCSKHRHDHRHNGFYLISGRVAIYVWNDDHPEPNETILEPGQFTTAAPGRYHQFIALADSEMLELYWPSSLEENDIVREFVGSRA